MTKNLWQRERQNIFRGLVSQYMDEGFDSRAAKTLAKEEVNDIMEDKEDFVQNIWKETFTDG